MNRHNFLCHRLISVLALGFLAPVALSLIDPGSWLHAATEPAAMDAHLESTRAIIGRKIPDIDRRTLFLTGLGLIFCLYCFGMVFYVYPLDKRRSDCGPWSGPPFKQRPLLNKGEGRLLTLLDRVVPEVFGPTSRVCPQVSYGEFLTCSKFSKFARMNSRRADFVVITADHQVALVVEMQGSGHFGSSSKSAWKARKADRTKRAALREAGIPLLELDRADSEPAVKGRIQELINPYQTVMPRDRPAGVQS